MYEHTEKKIRACGTACGNRTNHCPLKPKKLLRKKIVVLLTIEAMVKFYVSSGMIIGQLQMPATITEFIFSAKLKGT